jgi:hypothetical protein
MKKINKANFIIGIAVLLITILFPFFSLHAQDLAIVQEMDQALLPLFPENQRFIPRDISVDKQVTGRAQKDPEIEQNKFVISVICSEYAHEDDFGFHSIILKDIIYSGTVPLNSQNENKIKN